MFRPHVSIIRKKLNYSWYFFLFTTDVSYPFNSRVPVRPLWDRPNTIKPKIWSFASDNGRAERASTNPSKVPAVQRPLCRRTSSRQRAEFAAFCHCIMFASLFFVVRVFFFSTHTHTQFQRGGIKRGTRKISYSD